MKKFSLILTLVLLCTMISVSVPVSAAEIPNITFDDVTDFTNKFTTTYTNIKSEVVDSTLENHTGNVLKLSSTTTGGWQYWRIDDYSANITTIETDVYPGNGAFLYNLYFKDAATNTSISTMTYAVGLGRHSNNAFIKMGDWPGSGNGNPVKQTGTFDPDKWYHLTVVYDRSAQRLITKVVAEDGSYTGMTDRVLTDAEKTITAADAEAGTPAVLGTDIQLRQINLQSYNANEIYIDNVEVNDEYTAFEDAVGKTLGDGQSDGKRYTITPDVNVDGIYKLEMDLLPGEITDDKKIVLYTLSDNGSSNIAYPMITWGNSGNITSDGGWNGSAPVIGKIEANKLHHVEFVYDTDTKEAWTKIKIIDNDGSVKEYNNYCVWDTTTWPVGSKLTKVYIDNNSVTPMTVDNIKISQVSSHDLGRWIGNVTQTRLKSESDTEYEEVNMQNNLSWMNSTDTTKIYVNLTNPADADKTYKLLDARYDSDGVLIYCKAYDVTDDTSYIQLEEDTGDTIVNAEKIKYMLFDTLTGMKPMTFYKLMERPAAQE